MRYRLRWSVLLVLLLVSCSYLIMTSSSLMDDNSTNDHWSAVMQQRLDHFSRACPLVRRDHGRRFLRGLVVVEQQSHAGGDNSDSQNGSVAYCHIPKVASTWFLAALARVRGVSDPEALPDGELHRIMLSGTSSSTPTNSTRFLFVRHPLKRLLSAFADKFVRRRDKRYLAPLLRYLKRKRADPVRATGEGKLNIGFPDFVDFVLEELTKDRVSFGTFHWMPYYRLCDMCDTR